MSKDIDVKRTLIPLFLSFFTFLVVFNTFYSVFYVVVPLSVEDVNRFTPEAYVRFDDQPDSVIAHLTQYGRLKVIEYWYHWNYDGFEERDDYEPVVVYVLDDEVYAVASRIHYQWSVDYNPPVVNRTHVLVSFAYLWHTPMFINPLSPDWVKVNVSPVIGDPPEDLNHFDIISKYSVFPAVVFGLFAGFIVYLISLVIVNRFGSWSPPRSKQ